MSCKNSLANNDSNRKERKNGKCLLFYRSLQKMVSFIGAESCFDSDENGKDDDGSGSESAEKTSCHQQKRIENVEIIGGYRSFWISKNASMR